MTSNKTRPKRRLCVGGPLRSGAHTLGDTPAHYVRDVLRMNAGAAIELFDGSGMVAAARIDSISPRGVVLMVSEPVARPDGRACVTVAVAMPKGERADWAVEKLTEVGVGRIVVLRCARSVATPDATSNRVARWHRLADNASRQSGRATVPSIEGPTPLSEFLAERPAGDARFVADAHARGLWGCSLEGSTDVRAVVGPEGGLTDDELSLARQARYNPVSVGPHVLRVETAAVVAAATLMQATGSTSGRVTP